jgi:hypothetical protein
MAYLTNSQIHEMARSILTTLEVTPLSKNDKMRVAREYAIDEFGIKPSLSACGLAVKLSNMGWNELVINTKKELAE